MTQNLKVFKETSLPAQLQANSIYFVTAAPGIAEVYVTGTDASAVRHVLKQSEIQAMIDSSIASAMELTIVADLAARNALSPTHNLYVYVQNATGDSTVASGGATYLYNKVGAAWIKVSESESMDAILDWSGIQNKPSSSVAAIDDAVAKKHSHANKTTLDELGDDGSGNLTYGGNPVTTAWSSTGW